MLILLLLDTDSEQMVTESELSGLSGYPTQSQTHTEQSLLQGYESQVGFFSSHGVGRFSTN